jgi:hypothetical protein
MNVINTVTVQVTVTTEEEGERLREFLKPYAPDESRETLISYERKRGNDLEDEADKLRIALAGFVSAVRDSLNAEFGKPVPLEEYAKAAEAAIAAYDASVHKAIPF